MAQHVTFEHTLSAAFAHIGAAMDIFQSIPRPNGATTAALSNGHGKVLAKALSPQKVKKAALKALPAAPEAAAALAPVLAKAPKKVKAKATAKAKAPKKLKAKAAPAAKVAKAAKPAKVKAAAKSKAIVKVKAEKPAKVKAAKAAKAAPANAIAEGRRAVASGERPKLHDAVAIVMGKETLTAGVILDRLKERGWEPGATNPQAYISYTLSDNGETFKRGKRGEYSVINPKAFDKIALQFKGKSAGGKSSGKAERVASTDTGEAQAPATASKPEEVQATTAEAAPEASAVAGDPLTSTPSATAAATEVDEACAELGLGQAEIGKNPFDA